MAQFNITVNLDWLDEDGNIDEALRGEIVKKIVDSAHEKAFKSVETEALAKLNEVMKGIDASVSDRLNKIIEDFFTTPRDITDKWGDVVKKKTTVVDQPKKECESFFNTPVDADGCPTQYNAKYSNRPDYIVAKVLSSSMEYEVKNAVEKAVKKVKETVQAQINTSLGEKLGGLVGIGDLFKDIK
jgi:DNA-binding protein YbaB